MKDVDVLVGDDYLSRGTVLSRGGGVLRSVREECSIFEIFGIFKSFFVSTTLTRGEF